MTQRLLHIDASPRGERSVSRRLTGEFVAAWKASHPDGEMTYRDLGREPVPHVNEAWIAGAFTPPDQHTPESKTAIEISDRLIDEFVAADCYVLGAPMYNFNVPSTLKAYIDQIVRVGRTFTVDGDGNYQGLVSGKKLLVVTSRGGNYRPGSPAQPYDMQEPFLRLIFGFIGITDVSFIHADSLQFGDEARDQSLAEARAKIAEVAPSW
ncbi:FMN-dependent NADH-azoreductase [Gloeobacter morelensis]|uniref:FMN dependent NADH:quinone oxidoreductase n=1 Tax=Gloeobacter morelensis MG652769 TaxID=2781736 RepID=A0ABY3PRI0_9CYAN|nr:FMN-dependent NADH-azoreductase [Gloeobacter morelensis]UFP96249.1 FMN-dependent NADH-azoreductase [Gloeobacter morelensis MG652769]